MEHLEKLGLHLTSLTIDRRGMNVFSEVYLLFQILKCLVRIRPDYVITYTIKPNIYGGLLSHMLHIPYAANITGLGTAFQNDNLIKRIIIILYKAALKKAKVVFFENSGNQAIFLDNKIVNNYQACLLNGAGVDLDKFQYSMYPASSSPFVFLFVGRVMREKGIEELFSATKRLINDGYSVQLNIVGACEENYTDSLEQFESEGWLNYYGYCDDVIPYIHNCNCFVLPSYHEGMANTNLEAASSGRPLITSDIPGCREAVINGVSGLLCQSKDTESLYSSMKKMYLMSDYERENMGVEGRMHMEMHFDKNVVVKQTIAALGLRESIDSGE